MCVCVCVYIYMCVCVCVCVCVWIMNIQRLYIFWDTLYILHETSYESPDTGRH
jgi:hypothetical protein